MFLNKQLSPGYKEISFTVLNQRISCSNFVRCVNEEFVYAMNKELSFHITVERRTKESSGNEELVANN